jgi:ubiquinone/menaquinone biosynthesis C-methylase UbiE
MQSQDDQKKRVREDFDRKAVRWGALYEAPRDFRSYNLFTRRRTVIEMLEARTGVVLDVGCGTGDFIAAALERSPKVLGIEISSEMARACRARFEKEVGGGRAIFCLGDIEGLCLPDASIGGIICVGVIEYLLHPDAALKEIARVMAPGAYAVITVPNRISPFIVLDNATKSALRAGSRAYRFLRGRPRDDGSYMHGYFTPWGLNRRLREVGLVIEGRAYSTFGSYMYGNAVPFSVSFSEALDSLRHRALGVIGSNYIVRVRKPRPGTAR